jgi:hypothetical protein
MGAEGIPQSSHENAEDTIEESKKLKLSRTQKLIEFLIRRENNLTAEITEDALAAKSAIQYSGFKLPLPITVSNDDDDTDDDEQ